MTPNYRVKKPTWCTTYSWYILSASTSFGLI